MTSQSDTEIDFLPADFHVRRKQRSERHFRGALCLSFLVLIGAGLVGNRIQHSHLITQKEMLYREAEKVKKNRDELEARRKQIVHSRYHADLHGHLQLQPSATRLLALLTGTLPSEVALEGLKLRVSVPAQQGKVDVKSLETATAHQKDFERLAYETDAREHLVSIEGIAPDDEAISEYLLAMRETGAFDVVRLLYTDHFHHQGHDLRKFKVEAQLRRFQSAGRATSSSTAIAAMNEGPSQ